MLRRKLLARLGLPVAGFVAGAVVGIALLQGVLREIDDIRGESVAAVNQVQRLTDAMIVLEAALGAVEEPAERRLVTIEFASREAREAFGTLGEYGFMRSDGPAGVHRQRVAELLPRCLPDPAALRGTLPGGWDYPEPQAAEELAAEISRLREITRSAFAERQLALSRRLRTLIIGLSLGAIVMVNITVLMLLWTSSTIVRSVDALVHGSRELADEHFDHRVEVDSEDEFGELARAYNRLAERLQTNEQRKTETLRQLGVTLNHELNNAISVIEMQLAILDRRSGGDPTQAEQLRTIRASLRRIADTVASLKDVRRVVVTDYTPGTPMVDLIRSTAPDSDSAQVDASGESDGIGAASSRVESAGEHVPLDAESFQHEKLVAIGQLAAGVAHEVSNPLASMDGLLQLMQRYPDKPRPEAVRQLREQVGRISETVQQLRTLSHPDPGRPEAVDLGAMVDETLRLLAYDHRLRNVEVVREDAPDTGSASASPRAVQQALMNLVLNALDAMADVEAPRLAIRTLRDGSSCVIEVEDNGHGIDPDDHERVMRPFVTTKPVGRGTGLGLPISRSLIEDQGGQVEFDSEPGRGAAFRIRLPRTESAKATGRDGTIPRRREQRMTGQSPHLTTHDPIDAGEPR